MAEEWAPGLYGGRGAYLWGVAAPIYEDGEVVGAVECLVDITEMIPRRAGILSLLYCF